MTDQFILADIFMFSFKQVHDHYLDGTHTRHEIEEAYKSFLNSAQDPSSTSRDEKIHNLAGASCLGGWLAEN